MYFKSHQSACIATRFHTDVRYAIRDKTDIVSENQWIARVALFYALAKNRARTSTDFVPTHPVGTRTNLT